MSSVISTEKFGRNAYLKDRRFTKEDCQLLFALKTKMVDFISNSSHLYEENMTYRICNAIDSYEDEDHLLKDEEYDVRYSDVYPNIDKQYKVTNPSVIMAQRIFLIQRYLFYIYFFWIKIYI